MAIFGFIRKRQKSQSAQGHIMLEVGNYGGLEPTYIASFGEELKNNEASASCIITNSTYCSKVVFSSVRIKADGEFIHDNKKLDKLLQFSPNPLMTAKVFWERVATFYFTYNNAFIYVEKDSLGDIVALWALNPNEVKFQKINTGEILFKFAINSKEIIEPYSNIIHLAREVDSDIMFGSGVKPPIRKVLKLINLNYSGIEKQILTSAAIRYLLKYNTKVDRRTLKKNAENFVKDYLSINQNSVIGVATVDSAMELDPITGGQQKNANYQEVNQWNGAVYKYFGCPEKVIAGTATEEEMIAYYERTVEPFFLTAVQEMTRKFFKQREFDFNNRIVYSDRRLQYASLKTRLEVFKVIREMGIFTNGTLADLLGLPLPANMRGKISKPSQNYGGGGNTEPPDSGDNPPAEPPTAASDDVNKGKNTVSTKAEDIYITEGKFRWKNF